MYLGVEVISVSHKTLCCEETYSK